jgi:hypothetical protein
VRWRPKRQRTLDEHTSGDPDRYAANDRSDVERLTG